MMQIVRTVDGLYENNTDLKAEKSYFLLAV
jgi:hypothetical protein